MKSFGEAAIVLVGGGPVGCETEPRLAPYSLAREKVTQLYFIRDCKEPRRILEAIWYGYVPANTI